MRRTSGCAARAASSPPPGPRESFRTLTYVTRNLFPPRYAYDVAELEHAARADRSGAGSFTDGPESMGDFVVNHVREKYGVKAIWQRFVWELLCNAEAARHSRLHTATELFCAFVDGGYGTDDLAFFLFCRKLVVDELQRASAPARGTHVVLLPASQLLPHRSLTQRQCMALLREIFGTQTGMLFQALCQLVEDHFTPRDRSGRGSAVPLAMQAYHFLKLLISAYHDTRPGDLGAVSPGLRAVPAPAPASTDHHVVDHVRTIDEVPAPLPARDGVTGSTSDDLRRLIRAALPPVCEAHCVTLTSVAADDLGEDALADIRAETLRELRARATELFEEVLHAGEGLAEPPEPALAIELAALSAAPPATLSRATAFCDALVAAPRLRREVEPLVAYLVAYARDQLEAHQSS